MAKAKIMPIFRLRFVFYVYNSYKGVMAGRSQMSILLRNPYLVKLSIKVGGGQNAQKTVHVVYGWPWPQTKQNSDTRILVNFHKIPVQKFA